MLTGRSSTSTDPLPARAAASPAASRSWRSALLLAQPLALLNRSGPVSSQSIVSGDDYKILKIIHSRFDITDGDGNVALVIVGPWCTYSCAGDVEFKVRKIVGLSQKLSALIYRS